VFGFPLTVTGDRSSVGGMVEQARRLDC
jgi:hypothetical protein